MQQPKSEKPVNNSREPINPGRPFPEPEVKPQVASPPPLDEPTAEDASGSSDGSAGN